MYERHTFQTNHGAHNETIHANVTHLVMVPIDADPGELGVLMIRAFSLEEANDIARAHRLPNPDIWERQPNRCFAPIG